MRIAIITGLAGPGSVAGGVWEVVVNQATALSNRGHEVVIVAGWLGSRPPARLRGLEVRLVSLRSLHPKLALRGLIGGLTWWRTVREALKGADVAHIHLCRDFLTTHASIIARGASVPVVAQTHGMLTPPSNRLFKVFDKFITERAIKIPRSFITLTDSEFGALAPFGIPESRMITIPNTVPLPRKRWAEQETSIPQVLFASRLHARKQVLVFAQVIVALQRGGTAVKGIVAGPDQGELGHLQQFVESNSAHDYISYVGELDRSELDEQLARSAAFVFPALNEPFGLVLIEALAVGTPVISTSQTPLASKLSRSGAAIVADPTTTHFQRALAALLADPDLKRRTAQAGHKLYQETWTPTATVDSLVRVYLEARASAPAH